MQEGHRRVRAIEEQMVTSLQPDELKQFMKVLQICTNALEKHNSENSMEPQKREGSLNFPIWAAWDRLYVSFRYANCPSSLVRKPK